jgi:hypothetical protein
MTRFGFYLTLFSILAFNIFEVPSFGQVTQSPDVGLHPLATFGDGSFEKIDLSNLEIIWNISILSKPGSTDLPFSYSLVSYPNLTPG